jgi:hypothetical protein
MKNINKGFFINIWKDFLNESLNSKDAHVIEILVENLEKIKEEVFSNDYIDWDDTNTKKDRYHEFDRQIRERADMLGMKILGEGLSRTGFSLDYVDTVVLKTSNSLMGSNYIKKEINVSRGEYGKGSKNIFTKMYEIDKDSNPVWMIVEKVDTIYTEDESSQKLTLNIPISQIKKIFPTLTSLFNIDKLSTEDFVDSCDKFLKLLVKFIKDKYQGAPIPINVITFDILIEFTDQMDYKLFKILDDYYDSNLETLNRFDDLNKLIKSTGENFYHDFSMSNIGIDTHDLRSDIVSPDSIKILDLTYKSNTYDVKEF